jgi:RNA polymerase sigma-70 factor (ECF subfamily)
VTTEQSDLALVERVQRGDRSAFDVLVLRYQQKVLKLIMRYVRDAMEAEDVAQEAFIKAYRALASFRGDSAFYTWLYRISVNTAKKMLLQMKRDPLVLQTSAAGDDEDETYRPGNEPTDGATPDNLLASKQIAAAVNAAIDALSEDLRQAIVLREIEGLSYEEIAELMNCPIGTVRSRIFRAREAIALRLRPLLDTAKGERW